MSEEDVPKETEARTSNHERGSSFEDIEETSTMIAMMLSEIDEVGELDYFNANSTTYFTVHHMIKLEHQLLSGPKIAEVQQAGAAVLLHLPFSPDERTAIAQRIGDREADEWYADASEEDIVLIDRWRRRLDDWFHDETLDNPDNEGKPLIRSLNSLSAVCDKHAPPVVD